MSATRDLLTHNTGGSYSATRAANLNETGLIVSIVLVVPNYTNAVTVTNVAVLDDEGNVIYTNSTGWAKNATHLITSISVPCLPNYDVRTTLSGDPGDAKVMTVKCYLDNRLG